MLTQLDGRTAVALIAPSAAGIETVLERLNSISFDDMCRQLIPLRDHSVTEKVNSSGHPGAIDISATCTGGLEYCNVNHPVERSTQSQHSLSQSIAYKFQSDHLSFCDPPMW